MGRRGRSRPVTRAGRQDLSRIANRTAPQPDLDESADNRPNHITEKPVTDDVDRHDSIRFRINCEIEDRADRGPDRRVARRGLKRSEIVLSDQCGPGLTHRPEVERVGDMPGETTLHRIRHRCAIDSIPV